MVATSWPRGTKPVAFKWLFLRLACTCESVLPPDASLYVSSTCGYLGLLGSPFGEGVKMINARTFRYERAREVTHSVWTSAYFSPLLFADVLNTHVKCFLSSRNKWRTRSVTVKVKEKSKAAALEALVDLAEGALRWVSFFLFLAPLRFRCY